MLFIRKLLVEPINLFALRVLSSQMWNNYTSSSEVQHHVTLNYLYCTGPTERRTQCITLYNTDPYHLSLLFFAALILSFSLARSFHCRFTCQPLQTFIFKNSHLCNFNQIRLFPIVLISILSLPLHIAMLQFYFIFFHFSFRFCLFFFM